MKGNKPVEAANVPTPVGGTISRGQVSHDEIARRAANLWRERGYPAGQDNAIWLDAEAELKAAADSKPVSGTAARPYVDEPAQPVRARSRSKDPAEGAAQTRSATDSRVTSPPGTLRNQ